MKHHYINATAAAVALLFVPLSASAGYSFSTGAEYTRGDYGTDVETSSWQIPFTLGYAGERSFFSITVPYISVDGSTEVSGVRGASLPGKGGVKTTSTTTSSTETRTDSGLGDITLRASYQLQNESETRPWLGVTGKVKFGTADADRNLGTGENDYSLQLDMAKGKVDGFVGYHILGDSGDVDYDNIFYGAIGYSQPLENRWTVRGEFYTEQEAADGVDPVREISVGFGRPLDKQRSMNIYLIKGLSDSSPDWGAGVMFTSAL